MALSATCSVLVVDDNDVFCRFVREQLQAGGCECHVVHTYEDAVRILDDAEHPQYALLDHIGPSVDMKDVVARIRAVAPDVRLIGNSGNDRRAEFAMAGVGDYLQKPWQMDQLMDVIRGRIGECVDCGLELPLRRPSAAERGSTWVCAGCGSRYLAILDEQSDPELHLNVRSE